MKSARARPGRTKVQPVDRSGSTRRRGRVQSRRRFGRIGRFNRGRPEDGPWAVGGRFETVTSLGGGRRAEGRNEWSTVRSTRGRREAWRTPRVERSATLDGGPDRFPRRALSDSFPLDRVSQRHAPGSLPPSVPSPLLDRTPSSPTHHRKGGHRDAPPASRSFPSISIPIDTSPTPDRVLAGVAGSAPLPAQVQAGPGQGKGGIGRSTDRLGGGPSRVGKTHPDARTEPPQAQTEAADRNRASEQVRSEGIGCLENRTWPGIRPENTRRAEPPGKER